jgi:hypothetical protein
MTTLKELHRQLADLERREAEEAFVKRYGAVTPTQVTTGKVEWPAASVPEPPTAPGPVHRQLPVEKHMLDEREWVSQHHLGEKA